VESGRVRPVVHAVLPLSAAAEAHRLMEQGPQLPKGHSSILSPEFKYVPAVKTDLAKTFARIRERRLAQSRRGASVSDPVPATSTM
jgi:hypothetical protein